MSAADTVERVEAPAMTEEAGLVGPDLTSTFARRRWTREEYYRAAEAGIFKPNERLELIDGEVYKQVSPQNRPHALSVTRSVRALEKMFGDGFYAQKADPVVLSEVSEPEPDVAVIRGVPEDYLEDHPRIENAALVMEVSDTTYSSDTRFKASLYASVGVADYWVLNLKKRELEVRRNPMPDSRARFGWIYGDVTTFTGEQSVSPLAAPGRVVKVEDLLPPSPVIRGSENPADTNSPV